MPVIKFLPAEKKIVDHRSDPNGCYEAQCNSCGRTFFPKKSNALYCNSQCARNERKKNIPTAKKPSKKVDTNALSSNVKSITYTKNVYEFLSEKHNTKQKKGFIVKSLIALKIGEDFKFETSSIRKVGPKKYEVTFL